MKTWKKNSRLPFRATEPAVRSLCAAVAAVVCLATGTVTLAGCERLSGGTTSKVSHDPAEPVPGIEATLPDRVPSEAVTCAPALAAGGRPAVARVADPVAPKVTVEVPDGWSWTAGTGDTALTLTGRGGMSGTVTIAETTMEPGGAFLKYGADMAGSRPGAKFTPAGGQFCGYSSQLLAGTFQSPSGTSDFADRVTHIWTNTKKYLVSIQLQGPAGAPGFGAAKSTLMQQFAVVIP
jgi:hypothetical protein